VPGGVLVPVERPREEREPVVDRPLEARHVHADAGSRGLSKTGAGTVTLSGTNTYTGATSVSAGKLSVTGTIAGSPVALSGGTLQGDGTTGAVTATGGTLQPGTAVTGVLTTAGVSLDSSTTFAVRLNGTAAGTGYDRLASTGAVSLGGATLSVSLGFTPSLGDVFRVIDDQDASSVSATFDGLTEGSVLTVGGASLRISYAGGDGNDVTLTAVDATPPVSSVALTGTAGLHGWFASALRVKVSADDGSGSGIAATRCVLNPAVAPAAFADLPAGCGYLGPGRLVSQHQGLNRLYVASSDQAGNRETPALTVFKIDTVAPSLRLSHRTTGSNGWNRRPTSTVTLLLEKSDATSRTDTTSVSCEDGSTPLTVVPRSGSPSYFRTNVTGDGTHSVACSLADNAGNVGSANDTVDIDTSLHTLDVTFPAAGGVYTATGWNAGCPTAGLCGTAADAPSGLDTVRVSLRSLASGRYWNWAGGGFTSAGQQYGAATVETGGDWSLAFPGTNFARGRYSVHTVATDTAGNQTNRGFLVTIG